MSLENNCYNFRIQEIKKENYSCYQRRICQQQQQKMTQKKSNQRKISPFVSKLLALLEDPQSKGCIQWVSTEAFSIVETSCFSKKILPKYYKHHNISSFVRQLNIYGFTKLKSGDSEQVYSHPNFIKNNKKKLRLIQRKYHSKEELTENQLESRQLEKNNVNIAKSLAALKTENEFYKLKNKAIQQEIEKLTQLRVRQLQNMAQFLNSLLENDLSASQTSAEQAMQHSQTVNYILQQFSALKQDKLLANEECIQKMIAQLQDRKREIQQKLRFEKIVSAKQLPESLEIEENNNQVEPLPLEGIESQKNGFENNFLLDEDQKQFQNFLDNIF